MGISASRAPAALMILMMMTAASVALMGELGARPTGGAGQAAIGSASSIRGRVSMPGAAPPGVLKVTVDENVCGPSVADEAVVADKAGGIAHAVVTVKGLAWTGPTGARRVVNKGCRFEPHVLVARPGTTLEIASEDATLHTTHAYSADKRSVFNIAVPMPGIVIKRTLEAGVLRLACDTHPWMRGFIVVTADRSVPTGADGSFQIPDVPPGSYDVTVWHESLRAPSQRVAVVAGQPAELSFTLASR